jgi:hypothetical protein
MPRLRRLAMSARAAAAPAASIPEEERCGLCAAAVPADHRHLMDVRARALRCVCEACGVLFDQRVAGDGHYRRVTDRCQKLSDFALTDEQWAGLGVPVTLAFFARSTAAGTVVGHYPGPLGATEAAIDADTWRAIERDNPALETLELDVEALLVDRRRVPPAYWLVAIDTCYSLIGLMRRHWKGLSGGPLVQDAVAEFFVELDRRSAVAPARA